MQLRTSISAGLDRLIKKISLLIPADIKKAAGLKKYIHNTAWLFSEKVLRLALGVWIVIWVARYLGPAKFGLLNYAISFVGLFMPIASLGLDNILIKELTLNPDKENELMGSAFVLKLTGSLFSVIATTICCFLINKTATTQFLILISAFTLLVHPFLIFEFHFRSTIRSKFYALAMMTALLVSASLRVIFILYQFPLPYFAAVPAIELVIVSVFLFIFYIRSNKSVFGWHPDFKIQKRLIKDSWPLLFSGAMISIYMRIDQVMIQNMLGDEAVGFYSAAVRISEAWYFIPVVICQSVLPSIISSRDYDQRLYDKRLQRLFNLMVFISLSVAIPTTLMANILIPLLYGASYAPSTFVFQIHIWAGVFVSIGVAASNWLLAENFQVYYFIILSMGAVINIIANIFLIHHFSFYGAAIATILSQAFSSYMGLFLFSKTRPCFNKISRSFIVYKWFSP